MAIYKSNIYHIVKLQAFYRAHLVRKRLCNLKPSSELVKSSPMKTKHTIKYNDGSLFEGQVLDNKRHGYGKQTWPNGTKYTGYWENDKMSGKGKLEYENGDVYDCNWVDNKAKGFGELLKSDGSKYVGEWDCDEPHGEGTESWPDGTEYKGTYSHGVKNGRGIYLWSDGTKYEGEWADDRIEGFVTFASTVGQIHMEG
eukprot:TRINITY_DN14440_c0_g1_i13.p1 TRINITY_DN14440_c0_g1~~TRINITY_DN14440_c0_g1_i13.p1  ORF type:complete len:198 (-),score=18.32 TRINITY_DN14440_c0_g1_i13:174-767(-)